MSNNNFSVKSKDIEDALSEANSFENLPGDGSEFAAAVTGGTRPENRKPAAEANYQDEEMDDYRAYNRRGRQQEIRWRKLDTTAIMYPIISGESFSNVYRVSVTLKEAVDPAILQEALNIVLPKFDLFNSRLRQGVFWYYLEENGNPAPTVYRENHYPCEFIRMGENRDYLFRVSYFRHRINLEVYHVLADGLGAFGFLRELTYQYLRMAHKELQADHPDLLSEDTSLNTDDSFRDNYHKKMVKPYRFGKGFILHGATLQRGQFSVVHGLVKVDEIKAAAKKYNASINEYLVAVLNWSIYQVYKHSMKFNVPLHTHVPVNLRPYYGSITASNFFINVMAKYWPKDTKDTFENCLQEIKTSLREQTTKEHLETIFSQNVSSAEHMLIRRMPMIFKRPGLWWFYQWSKKAATTTLSNLGNITVRPEYQDYITRFGAVLPRSKGQNLKVAATSYQGLMDICVSSFFRSPAVQREMFRFLSSEGIQVEIETNGVFYQ